MTLLSGCGLISFRLPVSVCPPVENYSRQFQAQAADELALLPPKSAIEEMMKDYSMLRAQLRACS